MTAKRNLPSIEDCIAYMTGLGWKLVVRKRGWYAFDKETAPPHLRPMHWTLNELRHAYYHGF